MVKTERKRGTKSPLSDHGFVLKLAEKRNKGKYQTSDIVKVIYPLKHATKKVGFRSIILEDIIHELDLYASTQIHTPKRPKSS